MSTRKFPTICFVLISFILFFPSCAQKVVQTESLSEKAKLISVLPFSGSAAMKLKTTISFENAQMTGITIVKLQGDTVIGAFVNEFGLKGFEFVVSNGKCKVMHLMSKIDKWYIRRTLSEDLALIFTVIRPALSTDSHQFVKYNSRKLSYIYSLEGDKIVKIDRLNSGEITAKLVVENDSVFTLCNIKRKLNYNMRVMVEKE